MRPANRQRGQILPLGLILCVALLITANFLVQASRRLIARERAQMRADVTALSGGVAYARTLNVYATLEDTQATLRIGSFLPVLGPLLARGEKTVEQTQDSIESFGPYYIEGTLMLVGGFNEQGVIPLWNTDKPFELEAIKPSLNLKEENSSEGVSYHQKAKQGLKTIPPEQVEESSVIVRGRKRVVYRDKKTKRFVAKRGQAYASTLVERPHSLTLWTLNGDESGLMAQVSRVEVGGGKIRGFSTDSFASAMGYAADPQYGPWLAPVDPGETWEGWEDRLPELSLPRSGFEQVDAWLASAEERYARFRDLALSAKGELTH